MDLFWSLSHTVSSLLIYFWQVLDKILPLLVLIVAICAVYIAIQSKRESRIFAQEARIAAQGGLYFQIMARYSSNDMNNALLFIGKLFHMREQNNIEFLKVVKKYYIWALNNTVPQVSSIYPCEEIHQARRQVSHFFQSSFDLFTKFKVLDEVYFKEICSMDVFKHLYYVTEWLEFALSSTYPRKKFTKLLEQSGREDIEYLEGRRPPETWAEIEQMMEPKQK